MQIAIVGASTTTTDLGLDIAVGAGNYLHYNFLEGNIDPSNNARAMSGGIICG